MLGGGRAIWLGRRSGGGWGSYAGCGVGALFCWRDRGYFLLGFLAAGDWHLGGFSHILDDVGYALGRGFRADGLGRALRGWHRGLLLTS